MAPRTPRAAGAALLLLATASSGLFVPVTHPAVSVAGRYAVNADGSYGFDWPGVSFFLSVNGTATARVVLNGTQVSRLVTSAAFPALGADFEISRVWVGPGLAAAADNSYVVAAALSPTTAYTLRVTHDLSAGQIKTYATGVPLNLYGFIIDDGAEVLPAAAGGLPFARSLEFVGDSITVGAGAEGAPPGPCPYSSFLEHNSGTWDRMLCANLTANCSVVAWSGKGLYANANGEGEVMPQYYRQTLGAGNLTTDWDFARFTPDAVIVHLGTNDMSSPSRHAPGFAANFTAAYVAFVLDLTRVRYRAPRLPVFVALGPMNVSPVLVAALQAVLAGVAAGGGNASLLDLAGAAQDGCGAHPGPVGHQMMAAAARAQLTAALGW